MIIRQLKPKQYECLYNDLLQKAHAEPLETSYTVNMIIDTVKYSPKPAIE